MKACLFASTFFILGLLAISFINHLGRSKTALYNKQAAANTSVFKRTNARASMQQPGVDSSNSPSSYSIWLEPGPGPLRDTLEKEIASLLASHTGSPRFAPHVTLLGGMEMTKAQAIDAATRIAQKLKPYTLRFQDASQGTFFFQCVFLRMVQDTATMEAAALARRECGMEPAPYMPHLSLLYADLTDDVKKEVASGSQSRLFGPSGLPTFEFTASSISLYQTPLEGSVDKWEKVAEFPLSS